MAGAATLANVQAQVILPYFKSPCRYDGAPGIPGAASRGNPGIWEHSRCAANGRWQDADSLRAHPSTRASLPLPCTDLPPCGAAG